MYLDKHFVVLYLRYNGISYNVVRCHRVYKQIFPEIPDDFPRVAEDFIPSKMLFFWLKSSFYRHHPFLY